MARRLSRKAIVSRRNALPGPLLPTMLAPVGECSAVRPHGAHEPGETMLLALIQALIERLRCVGEAFEAVSASRHRIGAPTHALDRVTRARRIAPGGDPLDALLGEIAQRLLE